MFNPPLRIVPVASFSRAACSMLLLTLVLWLPASVPAQDEDEEDAFRIARNLFSQAGDYATSAELFF